MFKKLGIIAVIFSIVLLTTFTATAQINRVDAPNNFKSGAVYVLTNQTENSIAVFLRNNKDGTLTAAGTFPTGGAGNPTAIPPDPPTPAGFAGLARSPRSAFVCGQCRKQRDFGARRR
jgi:hypothetical protein